MAEETLMRCFLKSKEGCIIQDETVIVLGVTALIALVAAPVIVGAIVAAPILMAPK